MADNRLDFVIYGSTGFTGQFVVKEVANKAQVDTQLKWGVAGRSRPKILKALKKAEEETGYNFTDVKVIVADTDNYNSLLTMASQAKVVINCVGPYRFHGEPVVRACVESGASHVDISGEPEYLEKMEYLYNDKAKESSSYVVGACGFDSIPNDMGVLYCKQQFNGTLCAIDSYLSLTSGSEGAGINSGTWNTLVHSIGNWNALAQLRKKMKKPSIPKPAFKQPKKFFSLPFNDRNFYIPFMGADKSVVFRSQRDQYLASGDVPISTEFFVGVGTVSSVLKLCLFGIMFMFMCITKFGRSLLIKYPSFFSGGIVFKDGPPLKIIKQQGFNIIMMCQGYSTSPGEGRPDRQMAVRITGPDMGYIATSSCLVESAYTILREKDKLPAGGGVLTSGFAFKNTSLIERLRERNITFDVVQPM